MAERPLNILHLEDDAADAELVERTLAAAGLDCRITRVQSREQLQGKLRQAPPDLILSDYSLPSLSGADALALAKREAPDAPFIFISGTIGEDLAIESLLNGATDYVLKTGDMRRLVPAVSRALREAGERRERQRLEAQYRQAQKMEAIGRLAGGVAHDFNNLLTSILGLTELSLQELPADSRIRGDLEEVVATAGRAAVLSKQLLAVSRNQVVEPKVISLNELVKTTERMLRRIIGEDIELSFHPAAALGLVLIDPGQMSQLLLNLAVNARDAMAGAAAAKRIDIETANALLDEGFAARHPGAAAGRFVRLSLSDTGCGISEEVRAHLFEPFFTTKGHGQGTGLGLATCYGIVKQNAGYIAVDSAPGRGARFDVYLPAVVGRAEPLAAARGARRPPGGTETVLVVEDEAPVRRLAVRALCARGYRVLEAINGEQALRFIEDDEDKNIQLLLTDVVMPKSGGRELVDKVRALRPELKTLFTSGYMDQALGGLGSLEPGVRFLPKPYTPDDLARKVREVLDG